MAPTADEKDELLLSCRYGDLQDVQEFVKLHGKGPLADVRDENGNCVLHMVSGNGHIGECFTFLCNDGIIWSA